MEITKFSEKDMNAAISMARQTWHGYYDEFRAEYIRCIAECIVRHNYTDEDLAFKITCIGEVKGIIFGTRKGKMADLSVWVGEQCKTMNPQEKELLERLNDYMDEADRNTIAQMGDGDVKLSLFISIQKGCGRELLRAMMQEFSAMGTKRMFLWTDTSCDHDYYPAHGFALASRYRDTHYSTEEADYMTYIYWKPLA